MKKIVATAAGILVCQVAIAQSSVTLYGIVSAGIEYVNGEKGASNIKLLSGTMQNSRWGFRIREDLGGGFATVADLENGFDVMSGALQQGGRMFGRQAWVGLSASGYGTVTLGRQYDFFWDNLQQFETATAANSLGVHIGDNDNAFGGFRYNNSVKYVSPNFRGVSVQGFYAFGNGAGSFGVNRATSFGVSYAGANLSAAAAYLDLDHPGLANPSGAVTDDYNGAPFILFHTSPLSSSVGVSRQREFGAGGAYTFGPLKWNALFSDVRYRYLDQTSLHIDNYDTSLTYQTTTDILFGVGYIYTNGNYSGVPSNGSMHWQTGAVSVTYSLSKRTDVYLFSDAVWAYGARATAVTWLNSPSTTKEQVNVFAGIRHRF